MPKHELETSEAAMSFWDHLEALRWVLIKSIVVVAVATALGLIFTNSVSEILQRPLLAVNTPVELVFSAPLDAFVSRVKLGILAGIVLAVPFLLYFLWEFIAPGLHTHERRVAWSAIIIGTVMFLFGVAFGYRLLFFGLPAVVNMGLHDARHLWSLRSYLDFCFRFLLAFGVIFELPVVLVALGRLGLMRAATLRKFRAYAVIGIFLLAAIITPPDPLTQLMLGLPLLLLYEASIVMVGMTQPDIRENME